VAVYAGARLVAADALGNGYAATFLLSFALTTLGLGALLLVREPRSPEVRERARVGQRLRQLPGLLRSDRAFTRYFLARALATMGRMGVPFYWLFARSRIQLDGHDLGLASGAFILAQSLGNLAWGVLADRRGFRFVFLAALSLWMLSVLVLMQTATSARLVLVFVGLGAGLGGFQMSAQNLVLEFGSRRNLPMRIAVANSASDLVAAVGAVLGGALAGVLSYAGVFWLALGCQATAGAIVAWFVDEPRRRRQPGPSVR